MGYRHQVISATTAPRINDLSDWFVEKYKDVINFNAKFWSSFGEHKRYGILENFEKDIQKMLAEQNSDRTVRLVFFADESRSDSPDISHVAITKNEIIELTATWE